jgi:hypothetical protein
MLRSRLCLFVPDDFRREVMRCVILAGILAVAVLSACASAPKSPLSTSETLEARKRQLSLTTRVYEGVTREEALLAADKFFQLMSRGVSIQHAEDTVTAHNAWHHFLIFGFLQGTDSWHVSIDEVAKGVKVSVRVDSGNQFSFLLVSFESGLRSVEGNALYHLFFSRLDYLLGKADSWVTCRIARALWDGMDYYYVGQERYRINQSYKDSLGLGKPEYRDLTEDTYYGYTRPICPPHTLLDEEPAPSHGDRIIQH